MGESDPITAGPRQEATPEVTASHGTQQAGGPHHKNAIYQPLVVLLSAVAAGILADRHWPLPVGQWWAAAVVGLTLWLALWWRRWLATASAAVLLAAAAVAASWHHCCWHLFPADDVGHFTRPLAQPACIEAIALKTPRSIPAPEPDPMRVIQDQERARLEVELLGIRDGAEWRPVSGQARMLALAPLPGIVAGDRLRVFAQLTAPARPGNPGDFDTAAHLRADRVRAQLRAEFAESVTLIEPGRFWWPGRLLEQVRAHGNRIFARYLDERRSGLASAVLLGTREQLEPERTQAFIETGTIHVLVISGQHLTILAGTMLLIARRAPVRRSWALAVIATSIVIYTLLVDAEPPVVRATVLVLAMCGALFMGRQRLGFNTLALSGLIVLAMNPADLFHAGAQLSFLCVAGLMWIAPKMYSPDESGPLDRLIAENRPWPMRLALAAWRWARRITMTGAVIWLLVLPLVMARFHLFSPVAMLLATFVCVPIAAALLSGFGLLAVGTLVPPLAPWLAGLCNLSFASLEWLVTMGQRVPYGHVWVPGPEDWWLAGFYGMLGLLAAFPRLRPPRRWCLALVAAWSATGFAGSWLRGDAQELRCSFLAIGHGEAIVLELPSGQTLLYDAGQMGGPLGAMRSTAGYLWSRGKTHIDAIVLSHGDMDHYNALPGLLDRFSVGVIYVSPTMFDHQTPAIAALRESIERHRVPLREIWSNQRLAISKDCRVEVLHPPRRGVLGIDSERSSNANSVVLSIEYLGRRVLLTGDLEPPGLDDVLAEHRLPCDVLLVPHHGSRASRPEALATWSTPRCAVLSASHRWDTRPVEAVYERAGSQVLHTADSGAVTVAIGPKGMAVEGYKLKDVD